MKAKVLSAVSKVLAILFVVGVYLAHIVKNGALPTGDQAWGMVQVAIFVAGVFVPVDLSMIVRNIKGEAEKKE